MAATDDMAPIKVPSNLPELVRAAFNRARASGDVHFFPTEVALLNVNSVLFQLRFSPALAHKPQTPQPPAPGTTHHRADKQQQDEPSSTHSPEMHTPMSASNTPSTANITSINTTPVKKPFFDPFDNPPEAMLVAPLPPSHTLVLNKFAIVPEHFILATRAFKHQTHLLERDDLEAAYACVLAYEGYASRQDSQGQIQEQTAKDGTGDGTLGDAEEGLYVFFNSGAASGSSQPHRHIQLLPIARMREGLGHPNKAAGQTWDVLARMLLRDEVRARLPFQTFAEPISPGTDLAAAYARLYRRVVEAVLGTAAVEEETESENGDGKEARVDYNLAMTRDVMVIAPRVAEGEAVSAVDENGTRREVGKLALNGTVLAGTALVKHREEWDALRSEPEQLVKLLGRIGVPPVHAPSLL